MLEELDQIVLDVNVQEALRGAMERPYGVIVIAGHENSGRSSTLRAMVCALQSEQLGAHIVTVENPIECELEGVQQLEVDRAIDQGFSRLRGALRMAPAILMVDEIKDAETAELTLNAALTGHLMLTAIQGSDLSSVVQKLEEFGSERFIIAHSLVHIVVQRLVEKLCPHCTTTDGIPPVPPETLEQNGLFDRAAPTPLPRAIGCPECNDSGVAGRIAVFESLAIDDETRAMLENQTPLSELFAAAATRGNLIRFSQSARRLMELKLIGPKEALVAVSG